MKYIYKYQTINNLSLSSLRRGELFFASREELNDSSEGQPHYVLHGKEEVWYKYFEWLFINYSIERNLRAGFPELHDYLCKGLLLDLISIFFKNKQGRSSICLEDTPSLLKQFLFSNREKGELKINWSLFVDDIAQFSKEFVTRSLEKTSFYTCSFSETGLNPTMFGHYSNASNGIVLIFKPEKGRLKLKKDGSKFLHLTNKDEGVRKISLKDEFFCKVRKVSYSKNRPKVNGFHQISHLFWYSEMEEHYDVPLNITAGCFSYDEKVRSLIKFSDWSYEKEVRCIFPKEEGLLLPEQRVVKYDLDSLEGVIIGSNVNETDKERVFASLYFLLKEREKKRKVWLFNARNSLSSYSLKLDLIGFIDGQKQLFENCFTDVLTLLKNFDPELVKYGLALKNKIK